MASTSGTRGPGLSVTLRGVADDESEDAARQHDLEPVVAAVGLRKRRHDEREARRRSPGPRQSDCIDLYSVATQPVSAPARTPLNVEPMTIPTMSGATSGAERSALKPSKTPSTPPSNESQHRFVHAMSSNASLTRAAMQSLLAWITSEVYGTRIIGINGTRITRSSPRDADHAELIHGTRITRISDPRDADHADSDPRDADHADLIHGDRVIRVP